MLCLAVEWIQCITIQELNSAPEQQIGRGHGQLRIVVISGSDVTFTVAKPPLGVNESVCSQLHVLLIGGRKNNFKSPPLSEAPLDLELDRGLLITFSEL